MINRYITPENIHHFCFMNLDTLVKPIKGIMVRFHGYNDNSLFKYSCPRDKMLGENGVLSIFPYYNLWGWMNDVTVAFADELIDVAIKMFDLPEDIPLVYSGGSMGGLGGIVYSKLAKRRPVACCVDSPVCEIYTDFEEQSGERKRSIFNAYYGMSGDIMDILKEHSPLEMYMTLPKIPYYFVGGSEDKGIVPSEHGAKLAKLMQEAGYDAKFTLVEGCGHCGLDAFPEALKDYIGFAIEQINKNRK